MLIRLSIGSANITLNKIIVDTLAVEYYLKTINQQIVLREIRKKRTRTFLFFTGFVHFY